LARQSSVWPRSPANSWCWTDRVARTVKPHPRLRVSPDGAPHQIGRRRASTSRGRISARRHLEHRGGVSMKRGPAITRALFIVAASASLLTTATSVSAQGLRDLVGDRAEGRGELRDLILDRLASREDLRDLLKDRLERRSDLRDLIQDRLS